MFGWLEGILGKRGANATSVIPRRILIVDDDDLDLTLIKKTVKKLGHEAVTAKNGSEGLTAARNMRPDLILSDCRMPEMDGVEMVRRLKENEATKGIPVVFLTGVDTPKTVVDCFDMGVENYICKPIKPKILTNQIETIFKECLPAGDHPAV